jgi:hypothetical protein
MKRRISVTVENRTWEAGAASRNDSEVVVMWKSHLTTCADSDPQCPAGAQGSDRDARFRWRITVYQYRDGAVCHKNFGAFSGDLNAHDGHAYANLSIYSR